MQAGVIDELQDLVATRSQGAELFTPTMDAGERQRWQSRWDNAVKRSLHWSEGDPA